MSHRDWIYRSIPPKGFAEEKCREERRNYKNNAWKVRDTKEQRANDDGESTITDQTLQTDKKERLQHKLLEYRPK
jgi:hypothetical protein